MCSPGEPCGSAGRKFYVCLYVCMYIHTDTYVGRYAGCRLLQVVRMYGVQDYFGT